MTRDRFYSHLVRLAVPVAIYALLDRDGHVRWIGKSKRLEQRLRRHMLEKPWVVSCPIVEWADETNWQQREQVWIAYGRANGWPLENIANGGQGGSGWKMPEAMKQRLREQRIGKPLSATHRAKLKEAWKRRRGYTVSPEARAKRSAALKGHVVSEETARKISEVKRQRCASEAFREQSRQRLLAYWRSPAGLARRK